MSLTVHLGPYEFDGFRHMPANWVSQCSAIRFQMSATDSGGKQGYSLDTDDLQSLLDLLWQLTDISPISLGHQNGLDTST